MANIIQFIPKQKKKLITTKEDAYIEISQLVVDEWIEAANKNQLLQYIKNYLHVEDLNPLRDLSIISSIERRLSMKTMVISPNFKENDAHWGWAASFSIDDTIFALPMLMTSEEGARVMNAIIYVRFIAHLKSLNNES